MVESGARLGLDPFCAEILVCPRDEKNLKVSARRLLCSDGHDYPVLDGIPVMLLRNQLQTQAEGERSISLAMRGELIPEPPRDAESGIDPFVQQVIGATGGALYEPLINKLVEYPIPHIDFTAASPNDCFLDIGCNWGRWCIAAARAGYRAVGIDPNIEAIMAARRVARQLNIRASYLVADARYLPFAPDTFDVVHSYSVMQHLDKRDAERAVTNAARVAKPAGLVMIQWANAYGPRSLYHRARRGFRRPRGFEVRYWTPSELREMFERIVGDTHIRADGFLTLNPQVSDLAMLPWRYRAIVRISEFLRRASERFPPLVWLADSVNLSSLKR